MHETTCGFQILEVFCKQNLITSRDLPYKTTWVCYSFLALKKLYNFAYWEQDSAKWVFKHEREMI